MSKDQKQEKCYLQYLNAATETDEPLSPFHEAEKSSLLLSTAQISQPRVIESTIGKQKTAFQVKYTAESPIDNSLTPEPSTHKIDVSIKGHTPPFCVPQAVPQ